MRGAAMIGWALALAACQQASAPDNRVEAPTPAPSPSATPTPAASPSEAAAAKPLLNLAPDGLALVDPVRGNARPLPFGTPQFPTTQAVARALGNFTGQAENPECGAGPLTSFDYTGGLTLFFQEGAFAGWDMDGEGGLTTANGIGIGMTRRALEAAGTVIEMRTDSTIGHEFGAGDLSGLLSDTTPAGRVTNLWAGTTCIFR